MATKSVKVSKDPYVERSINKMTTGDPMTKVRANDKRYDRVFYVGEDLSTLHYDGSKKVGWVRKLLQRGPDMSTIHIPDIREVREGAETDILIKAVNDEKLGVTPDRCFSVLIGGKHKSLDLIAPSKAERDQWVHGLRYLMKKYAQADIQTKEIMWRKGLFRLADKDGSNALNFKEILDVLGHLNIDTNEMSAKELFDSANYEKTQNKRGEQVLTEEEFMKFCNDVCERPELRKLFEEYNDDSQYLDVKEIKQFLEKEQHMKLSTDEIKELIEQFELCPEVKQQDSISLHGFYHLMASEIMSIRNSKHSHIYQDMTKPFNQYFIDSSHNTYLLEDQLVGPSGVEAYIRALKQGCRCVELDCWDGDRGQPIIYHGHTFTSKILFRDAIEAIKAYAFHTSVYPVIVSIENHCSIEQQKIMASYMEEYFGDQLYTEPLPDDAKHLPSPEDLRERIIVKAKKLPASVIDRVDVAAEVSDEDEAADMEDAQVQERVKAETKPGKKLKLALALSNQVVVCQSVHFNSFEDSLKRYNFKQMSSFTEKKAFGLAEKFPQQFIKHNQHQISRIYPAGLRTDSSNYNPVPMWNIGAQIVALNYQTNDEAMQWNMGRFLDNGHCGYVLKPEILRKAGTDFNPYSKSFPASWKRKLTLQVISGWQLPKEKGAGRKNIVDPYVKVSITGVDADRQSGQTDYVNNNGFNPVWNEKFIFEIRVPQLALLRFEVRDHDTASGDELLAVYAMPIESLMEGYRNVPLHGRHRAKLFASSLLVHVKLEKSAPLAL